MNKEQLIAIINDTLDKCYGGMIAKAKNYYYTYECEKEQNEAKKEAAINNGYNFIFIINKDYTEFLLML